MRGALGSLRFEPRRATLRHVAGDDAAFDRLAVREGARLAGWPTIGPRDV